MVEITGQLISELDTTVVNGTEEIPVEKGGANHKVTVQQIKEFAQINEVEVNDTGEAPTDPNVEIWVDMTAQSVTPGTSINEVEVNDTGEAPTDPNVEVWVDMTEPNQIPTTTSDLENTSGFVADAAYVHTDNNFTTEEKEKLATLKDGSVVTIGSDGFWYIDGVKTNVEAKGPKGDSGVQLGNVVLSQILDSSSAGADKVLSLQTVSREFEKLNGTYTATIDLSPVLMHGNVFRDSFDDWNRQETLNGFRTKLLDIHDVIEISSTNNTNLEISIAFFDSNFVKIGTSLDIPKGSPVIKDCKTACYIIVNFKSTTETSLNIEGFTFNIKSKSALTELNPVCLPRTSNEVRKFGYSFKKVTGGYGNMMRNNESNPVKYSDKWVWSQGCIQLPRNYTVTGEPCRLIVYVPGSGNASAENFGDYAPYVQYLVDEGYVVAACMGWSSDNVGQGQCWCTPSSYASYHAFINYLYVNYNIKHEFFAFGKSQGGFGTLALNVDTTFKVLATCSLAGTVSPLFRVYGYNQGERMAALKDMGFSGLEQDEVGNYIGEGACMANSKNITWTEERKAYWLKNADKVKNTDPFFLCLTNLPYEDYFFRLYSMNAEQWAALKPHTVIPRPHLLLLAEDENIVTGENEKLWAGCHHNQNRCTFIRMPNGSSNPHHAVDTDGVMIPVKTKYGASISQVPLAYATMLDYFRHHE